VNQELMPIKLTHKQQCFADEYIVDLNATQAAIRAGYSKRTAQRIGSENLSKPLVAQAIQIAMDKRAARSQLTAQKVLDDIERVRGIAEGDGELTTALKASELQGKHLKMFTDKIEHGGDLSMIVDTGIRRNGK